MLESAYWDTVYCLTLSHFCNCSNPGSRYPSPTVIVISVFTNLRFTRGVASIAVGNLCQHNSLCILESEVSYVNKNP